MARPEIAVVDSNVIIREGWFMTSPSFKYLLSRSLSGSLVVCIPEVVIIELVARYAEKLEEETQRLMSAVRRVDRLRSVSEISGRVEIEASTGAYATPPMSTTSSFCLFPNFPM